MRAELDGFAAAVAGHTSLTALDVSIVRFEDGLLDELAAALPTNATLLHLALPPPRKVRVRSGIGLGLGLGLELGSGFGLGLG